MKELLLSVMKDTEEVIREIEKEAATRNFIEQEIEEMNNEIELAEKRIEKIRAARVVIQQIVDTRNDDVKDHIRKLIDYGLATVLKDDRYRVSITDGERGENSKQTVVQFIFNETGNPRRPGRAVKQVTSLLFLITLLEISSSSKFLVLDEYLNGVSGETATLLSDVLTTLSKNNQFQFFVVNHVQSISDNVEVTRLYLRQDEKLGLIIDKEKTVDDMKLRYNELVRYYERGHNNE